MLTLRQIEVIRAIMITGTVAGAARLLNVSAPGLSRLMKYTESSLGIRLFDRRNGRFFRLPRPTASLSRSTPSSPRSKIFAAPSTVSGPGSPGNCGSVRSQASPTLWFLAPLRLFAATIHTDERRKSVQSHCGRRSGAVSMKHSRRIYSEAPRIHKPNPKG